jgi:plastocyanin
MKRFALRVALVAALCGGPADAAPIVHKVTIDGFQFEPPVAMVKRGDIVEWRNADPVPHTATAKDAGLDSGVIAAGSAFRFTAQRKGRYDYVCTLHPTMKGTLVVE